MSNSRSLWRAIIFCALLALFPPTAHSADLSFSLDSNFTCNDNMICLGDAGSQGGRLTLTPDSRQVDISFFKRARGMALYSKPIPMKDESRRQSTSFSTSFSFRVTPMGTNGNLNGGDGLAFLIIASKNWIGSPGAYLGVYNGSTSEGRQGAKTLAVEFDTIKNSEVEDPNDNHVGINLETIYSKAVANADEFDIIFRDGKPIHVWIEYNGTTHDLEVWVSYNSWRPGTPILAYSKDLFENFDETMWVGFAAANGWGVSLYTINDWVFTGYGLPTGTDSAPPGLSTPRDDRKVFQFLVIALGVPLLLLLGAFLFCSGLKRFRKLRMSTARSERAEDEGVWDMASFPNSYSYKQLSAATHSFCEKSKLGQGGFGSVYKGVLPSTGASVAIKRVAENSNQGKREFMSEVSIITQIRHRNIVQLHGWCRNEGKFLLVYELMPNGSLDKLLFEDARREDSSHHSSVDDASAPELRILSWPQRFKIVHDLAAALDYLHEGWTQQVIHRDVKSSNVMLDAEFNAKLGDFGLARMVDHQKNAATTQVAGTYGYIAPEAPFEGRFTVKTDVYAFGAVALEIACGRRAFDNSLPLNEMSLVDWVWSRLSLGELLMVVDGRLEGQFVGSEMTLVLLLGLICSHPDPTNRPSMRQVIQILSGDVPMIPVPSAKPSPSYSSDMPQIHLESLLQSTTSVLMNGASSSSCSASDASTDFSDLRRTVESSFTTSGPLLVK